MMPTTGWIPSFSASSGQHAWHSYVEQVVSFQEILRGSQLTWYCTTENKSLVTVRSYCNLLAIVKGSISRLKSSAWRSKVRVIFSMHYIGRSCFISGGRRQIGQLEVRGVRPEEGQGSSTNMTAGLTKVSTNFITRCYTRISRIKSVKSLI